MTSPSPSEDKQRWLTHTEAADLIGVSYNTVALWARQGKLRPQKERRTLTNGTVREVTVFSLHDVMKFARRRSRAVDDSGEIAARAFELFENGLPPSAVVVQLRQPFEKVATLREQWMSCRGCEIVLNPAARRELERLLEPFEGVADLVQRVADLVQRVTELASARATPEVSQEPNAH